MLKSLRNGCSVMAVILGFAASAAASENQQLVRGAQERLNQMGYYSGPTDGVVGAQTKNALRDFQLRNGLAVTGTLTPDTYAMLGNPYEPGRYNAYYNGYGTNQTAYNANYRYHQVGYAPVAWQPNMAWNGMGAQTIPVRFGQLVINDDARSGAHNFTVTLNGTPVLHANNQTAPLKVSRTYSLSGEDAVIITAYSGAEGCAYKNFILSVKNDGTYVPAREIGNCTGNYEARVDGNKLFVNFPSQYASNGARDSLSYGGNEFVRF